MSNCTVKTYLSDSAALQTEAFQKAIDNCFLSGGGIVTVPAGEYRIGGIRLRSRVTLHLESGATLIGSRNPEEYSGFLNDRIEPVQTDSDRQHLSRSNNALIRAIDAEDIAILGEPGSVINGSDCYDALGVEGYRGPHAICMHGCRNVTLRGYTIRSSSDWAHAIFSSRDIVLEDVLVEGGHDGAHFRSCDNVTVRRCGFYTGDDCVAGFDNIGMTIEDCTMNTACSAFRLGGTHIRIRRCSFLGPAKFLHRYCLSLEEKISGVICTGDAANGHRYNMLSAFTYFADRTRPIRMQPGDIVLEDCVAKSTDRLLHYNYSGNEIWQCGSPLADIRFERLTAEGIALPLNAYGDADCPFTCVFRDSTIGFRQPVDALMHACHFRQLIFENLTVKGLENAPETPLVRQWSHGDITVHGLRPASMPISTDADEPFFAQNI